MKRTVGGLLVSLFILGFACRPTDDSSAGLPSIKAVSFVGIADKNVQFDPTYKRIVVTLPAVLPIGLKPVFDLTDNTRIVDGLAADNTIDLTAFCACNPSPTPRTRQIRIANQTTSTSYDLYVLPTGSLKAQTTSEQFTVSRSSHRFTLQLPVENLYAGPYVRQLTFTNLATGVVSIMAADGDCLNSCLPTAHDRLIIALHFSYTLETYFTAGTYRIAADGLPFPQRLVVTD